jgi:hypothetical protein
MLAMRIYVGASLLAIAVRGSGYRLQACSYEKSSLLAMRIYAGDAYLCRRCYGCLPAYGHGHKTAER